MQRNFNTWTELKALIIRKGRASALNWERIDDRHYDVWFQDGTILYRSKIPISEPASADQLDFETNFQPSANMAMVSDLLVRAGSLTGLTVNFANPLEVRDTSNPPVQISGGSLSGLSNPIPFSTSTIRASVDAITNNEDFVIASPAAGKKLIIKSILSSNLNFFGGTRPKFKFGSGTYFNEHNLVNSERFMFDYPKFDLEGGIDEDFSAQATGMPYSVTIEYEER